MGIATKKKRRLTIANREFIWYVSEDYDSADWILRVASPDKRFVVHFHLGQLEETAFLVVLGREFPGLPDAGGSWLRIRCPKWDSSPAVTPATVRQMIEWSLAPKTEIVRVDWRGNPLPALCL